MCDPEDPSAIRYIYCRITGAIMSSNLAEKRWNMRSLLDMDTIQIEITNACVLQCSNCTRLIGHSKKQYAPLIAEVYGNVLLNDHTLEELYHAPILVAGKDCIHDNFVMWYHIDHCWIQNCWSASITPKGAFFFEVAASFDAVFDGDGGWPVQLDWWKKTPKDYTEQMERFCVN